MGVNNVNGKLYVQLGGVWGDGMVVVVGCVCYVCGMYGGVDSVGCLC